MAARKHIFYFCIIMANTLLAVTSNPNVLRVDPTMLYSLPSTFTGLSSESFLQTKGLFNATEATETTGIFKPFISYDDEFTSLLADDASLEFIYTDPANKPIADEMGIWVWNHNQVWMASSSVENVSYVSILDLNTRSLKPLLVSSNGVPILNPNGGGYFNGKVYIAGTGNATIPPTIYEVDPVTYEARELLNSYFGLRFNGPNDLTWAKRGDSSWLFFTDDPLSYYYNDGDYPTIPDAIWRWDPIEKTLLPVIDRTDILIPNGIRVNRNSTKLYITDTPNFANPGSGFVNISSKELYYGSASAAIYVFDVSENGFPHNKRLMGIAQRGIPDGLHLDDDDRVWTGESDGIVVRNSAGKVLGMINALSIQGEAIVDSDQAPLQNFALAGDRVIILAYSKIYQVRLSRTIVENMT